MQMTPHYRQFFAGQQTDLLMLPLITRTWLGYRSGAIMHWCMILNPNKTTALVVSRSRTVSPRLGDLVLSGVFIRVSPNLDILGVKFNIKLSIDRPCAWYCFPCLSENWYFEVGEKYICGHLCVTS